jgi:hypothetical protein
MSQQPRLRPVRTADQELLEILNEVADEEVACRSGYHPWPQLVVGKGLPRGFRAVAQADGCYQITEVCPVCGTERISTTLKGGVFDLDVRYRYRYPDYWVRISQDWGATKRTFRRENFRRNAEAITAMVSAAAVRESQPAGYAVKFEGVS